MEELDHRQQIKDIEESISLQPKDKYDDENGYGDVVG